MIKMLMEMVKKFFVCTILIFLGIFFCKWALEYNEQPTAYISNSTQDCKNIKDKDGNSIGCSSWEEVKKGKYKRIWVR